MKESEISTSQSRERCSAGVRAAVCAAKLGAAFSNRKGRLFALDPAWNGKFSRKARVFGGAQFEKAMRGGR